MKKILKNYTNGMLAFEPISLYLNATREIKTSAAKQVCNLGIMRKINDANSSPLGQ
jgi:hypothetical protein